jgi:hypothetical protein
MQTPPQKMERGRRQQQQRLMSCRSARGESSTRNLSTGAGHELTSPVYGCSFVTKWTTSIGASPNSNKCCSIWLLFCNATWFVRSHRQAHTHTRASHSDEAAEPARALSCCRCPQRLLKRCRSIGVVLSQVTMAAAILDSTVIYPPNLQSHPGQAMPMLAFTQDNRTLTHSLKDMGTAHGDVSSMQRRCVCPHGLIGF